MCEFFLLQAGTLIIIFDVHFMYNAKCLTCMYVFISQIGEGDGTTGNMTGAHDLQLAPPSQPLSQATGTDTMFDLCL